MQGRVVEFDEHAGLGVVEAGGRRWAFHCTRIAGGSRRVDVGAEVRFELAPGALGTWEATGLEPVAGGGRQPSGPSSRSRTCT